MLMGRSLRAPEELRVSAGHVLPYKSSKAAGTLNSDRLNCVPSFCLHPAGALTRPAANLCGLLVEHA